MKKPIAVSIAIVIALGGTLLFAGSPGTEYDADRDGMIDGYEAVAGVWDYFGGEISQEQALDLVLHYFATVPIASAVTPTPTATPTATPTPSPTPAPTSLPIPLLTSVITSATAGHGSITVGWKSIKGASVYHVAFKLNARADEIPVYGPREWKIYNEQHDEALETYEYLQVGRYGIRTRAYFDGKPITEWSPTVFVDVSLVAPRPTPTPIAPRARGCSDSSSAITTIINPGEPTQMWHNTEIYWALSLTFWKQEFKDGNYSRVREAILTLKNNGSWTLKTRLSVRGNNPYDRYNTIAEGTVDLNTGWDDRNEVGFKLDSTWPIQIALVVNDTELPVEIDDAGLDAIRASFTLYERSSSGPYFIKGSSGKFATGNAVFQGFKNCHDR